MRSLERHELPPRCDDARFEITTDSGLIDQTQVASHDLDIRVYNRDFVDDHLGFLRDSDGNITPFAIVGSENKLVEEKLLSIREQLGAVDEEKGLLFSAAEKHKETTLCEARAITAANELEAKLTGKATNPPHGIKHNPAYKDPNYNTPKIKIDIAAVRRDSTPILSDEERSVRLGLLTEAALPDIANKLVFVPTAVSLHERARELLSKPIAPSQPIRDLIEDALLQAWVKAGIAHHRGKRDTCGFCGQPLPLNLWERLDAHFSQESEALEEAIGQHIRTVEAEIARVGAICALSEDDFYSTGQRPFRSAKGALDAELSTYVSQLERIVQELIARQGDIFTCRPLADIADNSATIARQISCLNALIDENNATQVNSTRCR